MKVALYKGMGFAHEFVEVEAGKSLCGSLPEIDFEHSLVIVNSKKSDGSYIPKDGDGIIIRSLPQSSVVAAVIGIVSIVVTVAGGIAAGIMAYRQKQELERQKKADRAAE